MSEALPPRCPNCDAIAGGRFCPQCGQKQVPGVPGALEYLHDLVSHYVAIDGKVWRTLALLAFRPGMLTTEYIAGRRQRYIGPLKLYLSLSVVFFVLASLLSDGSIRVVNGEPSSSQPQAEQSAGPPPAAGRLGPAADAQSAAPTAGEREIGPQMRHYAPRAMFLLLPAFAGLTRLAFRRRAQDYAVHLLFALHAHAMAYLLFALEFALPFPLAGALGLLLPLWLTLAFRRVFGGRWRALVLRAIFVSGAYALLLLGSVVGGALLLATRTG